MSVNAILEGLSEIRVDLNDNPVKIPENKRKFINKKLQTDFGKTYFNEIPLKEIFNVLKSESVEVVDEDGTAWQGFLTGASGNTQFDLAIYDSESETLKPVKNAVLVMSWYKMSSGRYEINCYLS